MQGARTSTSSTSTSTYSTSPASTSSPSPSAVLCAGMQCGAPQYPVIFFPLSSFDLGIRRVFATPPFVVLIAMRTPMLLLARFGVLTIVRGQGKFQKRHYYNVSDTILENSSRRGNITPSLVILLQTVRVINYNSQW